MHSLKVLGKAMFSVSLPASGSFLAVGAHFQSLHNVLPVTKFLPFYKYTVILD